MPFDIGGFIFNGDRIENDARAGIVTDGLVLHLDAGISESYPKSGTGWYDISGNGNNGTLVNGPTYNSSNGGSFALDGADDYISTNSSGIINLTQGTISCWCKYDSITNNRVAVSYGGNGTDTGWLLQNENNTVRKLGFSTLRTTGSQLAYIGETNSTQYIGKWIYQVGVYDSSSTKVYINGNLGASVSASGTITNSNSLWIGGEVSRPTYHLDGNIAGVTYHNRALSAAEITQNFNAQRARFGV